MQCKLTQAHNKLTASNIRLKQNRSWDSSVQRKDCSLASLVVHNLSLVYGFDERRAWLTEITNLLYGIVLDRYENIDRSLAQDA